MIDPTRHHEEQIGQSVRVAEQNRFHGRLQLHDAPLGAATDSTRKMKRRPGFDTARQDEMGQRREVGFQPIDEPFEPLDVCLLERRLLDPRRDATRWIGKPRPQREEIALDQDERVSNFVERAPIGATMERGEREAETGTRFVDLSVGVDPRIAFRDPGAAQERRVARITSARVDFHGVNRGSQII